MHRSLPACCLLGLAFIAAASGQEVTPAGPGLAAAIEQARKTHAAIQLGGGVYLIEKPIVIAPEDSGLIIEAKPGETPVLSGGRRIERWRTAKFNGRDCWAADVPTAKEGQWFFRELWIDGKRATRSRRPDRGSYFHVVDSPDAGEKWDAGQSRMRFDGNDVPPGPFSFGAEAIVMSRWVESRLPIRSVDADKHLVDFSRVSQWRMEKADPYWLEGDGRWLDQPGEWFLDRAGGTIYYLPLPGQSIDRIEAIAPAATTLIELRGTSKTFVENVTFRGISFAHTQWTLPDVDPATTKPTASGGFAQAAIPVPAAVAGQHLRNVTFERCAFRNLGTWGLELGTASQNCRVDRCTFTDLGAGGIKLGDGTIHQGAGEQTFANRIEHCEIADAGNVFPSAVGIWIGQAFDNVIAGNHIHDLYYSGISAGWSWGYGDSLNRGNIIERNRVHHVGKKSDGDGPILSDMGCVYLLGARNGTVVRNNHFHDVAGVKYGGWCIYLDEGSSDVVVENNLAHHATHGLFHLHYGRDNIVRNNVFAFGGTEQQIVRTREEDHNSFTFERNIVCWTGRPMTKSSPKNVKFDRNVYAGVKEADFRAGGKTWQEWRAAGEDAGSFLTDQTIFRDAEKGDFAMQNESLAKRIGFVPFEWPR